MRTIPFNFLLKATKVGAFVILLFAICIPQIPKFMFQNDNIFSLEEYISQRNTTIDSNINVIVTGANSGLGFATVQHLSKIPRIRIVLACRSISRCLVALNKIKDSMTNVNNEIICRQLDLESRNSIKIFAEEIEKDMLPIHILIHNAGIFSPTGSLELTEEGFESQVMVNHLGSVLLTHYLWKNLVDSKARIVLVSSITAMWPFKELNNWRLGFKHQLNLSKFQNLVYYFYSKKYNIMFAAELARRYPKSITAVASHPGYTATDILVQKKFDINFEEFRPDLNESPFFRRLFHENKIAKMQPAEGSLTQVRAALDKTLIAGDYVGPYYWTFGRPVRLGSLLDNTAATSFHFWPFTQQESTDLFDQSLDILGIKTWEG